MENQIRTRLREAASLFSIRWIERMLWLRNSNFFLGRPPPQKKNVKDNPPRREDANCNPGLLAPPVSERSRTWCSVWGSVLSWRQSRWTEGEKRSQTLNIHVDMGVFSSGQPIGNSTHTHTLCLLSLRLWVSLHFIKTQRRNFPPHVRWHTCSKSGASPFLEPPRGRGL